MVTNGGPLPHAASTLTTAAPDGRAPGARGGGTVVFWSAHCGPARAAVPEINQLSAHVPSLGARVLVLSDDSLTAEDLATLRSKGATFAVYHDDGHGAQRALSSFGTPAFYVLDADGHLRFEWARPDDIMRELFALGAAANSRPRSARDHGHEGDRIRACWSERD